MTDIVSRATRSRMMSGIRGVNTRPELAVRSILHRLGYRFRLHQTSLAGRPDVVLRRHRIAVFVHGCFWHRHKGCRYASVPSSNTEFWKQKLAGNALRDSKSEQTLLDSGWRVLVVWECFLRDQRDASSVLSEKIRDWMVSRRKRGEIPGARMPRQRAPRRG